MQSYETVTEALSKLKEIGYTLDFNIRFDQLHCAENNICLHPEAFEITEIFRFEGDTNPSDEDIVYAITSIDGKWKGTLTSAYGMYADSVSTEMIRKLSHQP